MDEKKKTHRATPQYKKPQKHPLPNSKKSTKKKGNFLDLK